MLELCITHLPDAFRRFLKLDSESQEAHKAKRFEKIQEISKLYMSDLVKVCIYKIFYTYIILKNSNYSNNLFC